METRENALSHSFRRELNLIIRRARKVWRLVPRRHKLGLGGAALVMALVSAVNTAIPLCLGRLVDSVQHNIEEGLNPDRLLPVAALYLGLIAGFYMLREALQVGRRYMVENTCTRIEKLMTIKLVSNLLRADLATLTHDRVGSLNGRIQRSIVGFVRFLRLSFLDFFPAVLMGVFALAAASAKQPYIGLVMLGVVPISVFLTVRQLISQKGVRLSLVRSREVMEGTVVEQLSGIEYVRAANTHHREVERVARAAEKRRAKELRHHLHMSLYGCGKALNEGFWHIAVLSLAIYLATHGRISFGDILMFSMLFLSVMTPLNEVHRVIDDAHECSLHVADLLDILGEPVDFSFSPAEVREPSLVPAKPAIEVRNLVVEYTLRDGQRRRALDGISMSIGQGETIGVAGPSGSGKSTWLRAIMRLIHGDGGEILLGGVPIQYVSRESIARLIGYVGQYPFVFTGTIAENIAYGCENATEEDIHRAACMACMHDEITAMPGGYQAPVAERGQNLSGGQKQRLALARVFLKNPPILILDEGTSALDNINERRVQEALTRARADRTVILVAHRLSTLADADRILVFEGGQITEVGTYAELVQGNRVFSELVKCAASMKESPSSPPEEEKGHSHAQSEAPPIETTPEPIPQAAPAG